MNLSKKLIFFLCLPCFSHSKDGQSISETSMLDSPTKKHIADFRNSFVLQMCAKDFVLCS
jgi:hypothetical protein